MPVLRLRKHQANFSEEDILIHPSDYIGLKLNDVVELKPAKDGTAVNRILLQVRKWPDINSYPNSVSIKDTVVNANLKLYGDVLVSIVNKKDVVVDSIEICFSNAYLARSYMWGLRNHLDNRCVYQRQKLDYLNIHSQICEIWSQGNKVTSGYVDDDTKIVFRSASSLVYLFIQMSSEMWDYDINGDLYCEKAINGFLTELFETWRRNDCSHDITIILFSRTFYDAESLEEFPKEMRECLQLDYKNRFYEDCYRVAFQNDRFDLHDWNAKLTTLKSLFNQYQKEVIDRHRDKYSTKIPRAYNSNASQGNFLEVLNMSLNVFEKHYFDRSFDRTGQLSVVVSPGVGVFEVDFEMTNLTKQRIIDNGIGSDLVCLGEQPLHTVPLLKFNSKSSPTTDNLTTCDVYNMPHWINLSFYSSQNQVYYSNFIPRIKLPTIHNRLTNDVSKATLIDANQASSTAQSSAGNQLAVKESSANISPVAPEKETHNGNSNHLKEHRTSYNSQIINHSTVIPDLVDYDDYDAQVFKPNSMVTYNNQQHPQRCDRSVLSDMDSNIDYLSDNDDDDFLGRDNRNKSASVQRRSSDVKNYQEYSRNMKRQQMSENLPIGQGRGANQAQNTFTRMSLVDNYLSDVKIRPESADDLSVRGYNVQSSRLNRFNGRPKALINPFDPSHMTIKLTPNRRRWTHVFPQGPTGTFMQQHHYQPVPQKSSAPYLVDVSPQPLIPEDHASSLGQYSPLNLSSKAELRSRLHSNNLSSTGGKSGSPVPPIANMAGHNKSFVLPVNQNSNKSTLVSNDTIRFAWCASGEQEWTPAITTGVDWKSLTMPACLPLTTDFFPSQTSLQNDYVIGEYTIDSSCIHPRYTLIEVYRELVCQRLQKGFQIILLPNQSTSGNSTNGSTSAPNLDQRTSTATHKSSRSNRPSRTSNHAPSDSNTNVDSTVTERTSYTMSIGRIFHKLSLDGNTVTVTQYRPRHPYPTIKIDYCYRFRAPFHDTYGQSWVFFKSEKLENYSWNYLDNYICARGESFELRSSLKFWRFRVLVLPSQLSLRKQLRDNDANRAKDGLSRQASRHDIYHLDYNDEERASLMDSFVKLLEIINKTRRASACRTSTGKHNQISPTRLNVRINSVIAKEPIESSTGHNSPVNAKSGDTRSSPKGPTELELKFESINMDIDSALRDARRAEWVHVQYHSFYDVNQAFELVIKWMVASGAGIAEMVQGWSRKVGGSSSVHLVPIPWEPFALPHSGKADPLRCPIGIELNLDCLHPLVGLGGSGLNGCKSGTLNDNQVIRFQERILRHYGFLTFHDLISSDNIERQFVHISGFAFVALPNLVNDTSEQVHTGSVTDVGLATAAESKSSSSTTTFGLPIKNSQSNKPAVANLRLEHQDTVSSPHEEYITRHISGARKNKASRLRGETNEQFEFIWSWNYMLTKRWRSPSTQDESQAVSLMLDFKDFCSNGSNRLVEFWEQVKDSL